MPTLECPICRKQITYQARAEIPFRPFCSQRCKLLDLGKWLNEEYRISEELPPEFEEDEGERPPPRSNLND